MLRYRSAVGALTIDAEAPVRPGTASLERQCYSAADRTAAFGGPDKEINTVSDFCSTRRENCGTDYCATRRESCGTDFCPTKFYDPS